MKKLLALMLVLSLTTIAGATVQLRIGASGALDGAGNDTELDAESADIYVYSDAAGTAYDWYVSIAEVGENAGDYGTVTGLAAAGPDRSVGVSFDGPIEGYFLHITDIGAKSYDTSNPVQAGNHFWTTLSLTGSAVQIDLLDDSMAVIDSVTLTPEPMTLALLGLGGLFIRRK